MKLKRTGPYLSSEDTTASIMLDVAVALIPAFLWGVYVFGLRVLTVLALSVLFCGVFEFLMLKIFSHRGSLNDYSFLVTAAIFTAMLPPAVSLWLIPLGSFLAICVFKHLFGGLGKNILNPALSSFLTLRLFFGEEMTRFTAPFTRLSPFALSVSEEMAPTVAENGFSLLNGGVFPADLSLTQLLTGSAGGGIASSSVLLLLAGGLYLLVRRVISWHIPFCMLTFSALLYYFFPYGFDPSLYYTFFALGVGSALFGAVYLATDPATSPLTGKGKFVYGALLGVLTVLFRYRFDFAEGAYLAILLLSVTARLWDFVFRPRVYGHKRHLLLSLTRLGGVWKGEFDFYRKKMKALFSKNK